MQRKTIQAESSRPRPSAPKRFYGFLHTTAVGAARRLPIPSKVFGPPKGIIPDMKEWVTKYPGVRPNQRADCWYSTVRQPAPVHRRLPNTLFPNPPLFIDEQTKPEPEIFHSCLPGVRVLSRNGLLISPDDRVFEQSCSWGRRFFPSDIEYNSLRRKLKPQRLGGSYTTILSRSWRSYYHWFSECLTRLPVAEGLPETKIYVPNNLSSWHRQSLTLLGVHEDRLLELEHGCYEVERLYFPSFPGVTGHMAGWAFRELREKFRAGRTSSHPRRIYVSRDGAPFRRVVNEDEVMRALEPEGFTAVVGHKLSIAEQVELFAGAEIVVGGHGAGLTNILFAPEGTTVIEVFDPAYLVGCYYGMAESLGHNYWYLFGEGASAREGGQAKGRYDDLYIPVEPLLRTLSAAARAN